MIIENVFETLNCLKANTTDEDVVLTIHELIGDVDELDEDGEIAVFRALARQLSEAAMAGDVGTARAAAICMEEIEACWTEFVG